MIKNNDSIKYSSLFVCASKTINERQIFPLKYNCYKVWNTGFGQKQLFSVVEMCRQRCIYTEREGETVCCVAKGSSHVPLWLYNGSVFRGLQCGDAWHGGVKLPVKPTETGKGHRQQHTLGVSLCFLTVPLLSVLLVFLETTWYETSSLTYMAQDSRRTISDCEHPGNLDCHTHTLTHSHTSHTRTNITYGSGFNPLCPLSKTRSFHQLLMDDGYICELITYH